MVALVWVGLTVLLIVLPMVYPRWRRARVRARPLPPSARAILQRNVAVYAQMPAALQTQLHGLVVQFLYEKKFVGCDGLDIDDEIRVTIAGYACLLLLNRPSRVYPGLHTILVYPSEFLVPHNQPGPGGVITPGRQRRLGESWGDGRVVLSWNDVPRGADTAGAGQNVVLHEFAHQLDTEAGGANGAPCLGHPASYSSWSQVLSHDFANLRHDAAHRQHSVLDHYGATSPAEFFAVATETFFEKPYQMAEQHAALFAQLQAFYRVDPRAWLPAPLVEMPAAAADFAQSWH